MEELLKLIKANMKEGADLKAIETLVKGLDVLAGVETAAQAADLINSNPILSKGRNSLESAWNIAHEKNFTEKKLPGILKAEREKIIAEVDPKETPQQKTIREQGIEIANLTATGKKSELKATLEARAKELGYGGNVELFLSHGEKAGDFMEVEAKRYKTEFDSALSSKIKDQFGHVKPKSSEVDPAKSMKRADYESMDPNEQANVNFSDITLVD